MATLFPTSTPSPPPGIRTPATPKHGFSDPWEPYSPRKSTRLSSQRAANKTPSPRNSHNDLRSSRSSRKLQPTSSSGMVSPGASPQKKQRHSPAMDSITRAPGRLTSESTTQAAMSLGTDNKTSLQTRTTISHQTGMLPTPSKTPKKAPAEKNPAIQAIARNLFASDDELMPSPKKKRAKKYTGVSMESFTAEDVEEPIQIFTDSHDRLPERDESTENPFYGDAIAAPAEPARRRSKRNQVLIPGEGRQTVEQALQREDGMVYVFRGKKIFRKFADFDKADKEPGHSNEAGQAEVPGPSKPLTRSSIKPRLLFPVKPQQVEATLEDEEADTDLDEHVDPGTEGPQTPNDHLDSGPKTPKTPKFGPVSPPDTKRVTRYGGMAPDETPIKAHAPRSDHFEAEARSTKRSGETIASAPTKRARA